MEDEAAGVLHYIAAGQAAQSLCEATQNCASAGTDCARTVQGSAIVEQRLRDCARLKQRKAAREKEVE